MVKVFSFFMCALAVIALSGCKTMVQDGPKKIIVDDSRHSGGDFCPPGQAKKGNC
jgi:hypothetical protein